MSPRNEGQPEVRAVSGRDIAPWLEAVARLRIAVFREWPYLYQGDADYERRYLATYARSSESLFVLALADGEVVGASTGVPLRDESEPFRIPFRERGIDESEVFYFGESVLLPAFRGMGVGHRFFDLREAYARSLGRFRWTAFCAVTRRADDLRRPPGFRPLDGFWQSRGYLRQPEMVAHVSWRELGEREESEKPLVFWLRRLAQ